jgi:hypothetical protein
MLHRVISATASFLSWKAIEPDLSRHGIGGELCLYGLEELAVNDRLVLALMHHTTVNHLADMEPLLEQMGKCSAEGLKWPIPASIAAASWVS